MIIKIELQHFISCSNSPILIERVKEAIKDFRKVDYQEILVDSDKKALEFKFRGSPTLLINGKDFENQPEPNEPALACRYYPKCLPTVEQIKGKLQLLM